MAGPTGSDPTPAAKKRPSYVPRIDHSVHLLIHADKFTALDPRTMKEVCAARADRVHCVPARVSSIKNLACWNWLFFDATAVSLQRWAHGDNKLTLRFDEASLVPLTCIADVKAAQLYDKHLFMNFYTNRRKGMNVENIGQCAVPLRECLSANVGQSVQYV